MNKIVKKYQKSKPKGQFYASIGFIGDNPENDIEFDNEEAYRKFQKKLGLDKVM